MPRISNVRISFKFNKIRFRTGITNDSAIVQLCRHGQAFLQKCLVDVFRTPQEYVEREKLGKIIESSVFRREMSRHSGREIS